MKNTLLISMMIFACLCIFINQGQAVQVGVPDTPTPKSTSASVTVTLGDESLEINAVDNDAANTMTSLDIDDSDSSVKISLDTGDTDLAGMAMFGNIHVKPNEIRDGDVIVFGGTGIVEGRVTGSVVVFGGHADVTGHIEGDLVMMGGTVELGPESCIDGSLVTIGGVVNRAAGAVVMDDTAVIGGQGIGLSHEDLATDLGFIKTGVTISILLTWLVLAFITTLIFNRPIESTALVTIDRPLQSLLAGFLFHVITLMTCLLLSVIIIGLPLAALGAVIWLAIGIFGTIAGFVTMGRLVMQKLGKGQQNILVLMLIGFVLLAIIRFLPLFIGWTLWQLWAMAGIGATILSRFGSHKPWFGNSHNRSYHHHTSAPEPRYPEPPHKPQPPTPPQFPSSPQQPAPPQFPTPPQQPSPPAEPGTTSD